MGALLQAIVSVLFKAPDWILIRLSGRPQEARGHRKLLPAFQLLCAVMEKTVKPVETLTPPEARAFQDNAPIDLDPLPKPAATSRDQALAVDGAEITIRVYEPPGATEVLPGLVYFHGGGWVLGNLDSHHGLCTRLATVAGCRVFSVDYRLAPEFPFPTPLRDCEAAFAWVCAHAEDLGVDPARIAAGGDSAGGNLTAALCLARKAEGKSLPCLQLLIYPSTDFAFATNSFDECGKGLFLSRNLMEWFRGHYLPDEAQWKDPLASPLLAPELAGHPPAIIATAGFDPLCDDGIAYAKRLEDAGVDVTHRSYDSLIHGFANMGLVAEARTATEEIASLLAQKLG